MSIVTTDDKHYKNIADTIREKTGTENSYAPEEMSTGVNEVYTKGKADGDRSLWDIITNNNTRTNYTYGFFRWEGAEYLRPPYKIIVMGASPQMFAYSSKIKAIEKNYFDLSGVTGASSIFRNCFELEKIEDCGLPALNNHDADYINCYELHTIERIRSTKVTTYLNSFNSCNKLVNVEFNGEIGQNISFPNSPLSIESLKSIISCLADYAGTADEFKYTLTLKSDRKTALENEGATSPNGNTWIQYAEDKGWNVV